MEMLIGEWPWYKLKELIIAKEKTENRVKLCTTIGNKGMGLSFIWQVKGDKCEKEKTFDTWIYVQHMNVSRTVDIVFPFFIIIINFLFIAGRFFALESQNLVHINMLIGIVTVLITICLQLPPFSLWSHQTSFITRWIFVLILGATWKHQTLTKPC